jgi:O-antigen/teichoic acid export membrane protein
MMKYRATIVTMTMLYAGKTSGVLVAFVFLPLYSHLLGHEQFGVVAVILSLQALLLMMDLGMSTLVSRAVAVGQSDPPAVVKLIRAAEINLTCFYLTILLATALIKAGGGIQGIRWDVALGAIVLFWLVVVQNLYYTASLAGTAIKAATLIHVIGILSRSALTWYLLDTFSKTISVFIWAQIIVAVIHGLVCRKFLIWNLYWNFEGPRRFFQVQFKDCLTLLARGKSILVSGTVGAAAMQLDKPILSIFMPASDISPYFLATVLSATPVAIMAGPIVQFFQPKIVLCISTGNVIAYQKKIREFLVSILALVIVPVVFLFFYCDAIVILWLGPSGQIELVSSYSRILLIGYGIASVGYLPYVIIVARQEFRFHARLSTLATIFVLFLTAIFASLENIFLVCIAYVAYFLIVTLGLFWRANTKYTT